MMYNRAFNTIEEAIETWQKEREKQLVKSGILCRCSCYTQKSKDWKYGRFILSCMLILPEKTYDDYKRDTQYYPDGNVVVQGPGIIRVRWNLKETDNYSIKQNLCAGRCKVDELLDRHLGQKVRLGKNLIA